MRNFIIFLVFANSLFSLEKYKEENVLSVWSIENKKTKLVEHKRVEGLEQLNSLKYHDEMWKVISEFYPEEILNRIHKFVFLRSISLYRAAGRARHPISLLYRRSLPKSK